MGKHSTHSAGESLGKRRAITVVQAALVIIAVIAAGWLILKMVGYNQAQEIYHSMQSAYAEEDAVNFDTLAADYPGAVAWIRMDDLETINYPIMQGEDNDFYLHNDPAGQPSIDGSIFLDYRNASVADDPHAIIYGHNMRDGSMFGTLISYEDEEFYKQGSGKFTVYTPGGKYRYQIFAVNIVDPTDDSFLVGFKDAGVFSAYVEELKQASMYETGVEANGANQVVTLSTCSSTDRLVVSAKRVAE